MASTSFIVVSVSDRVDDLNKLVEGIVQDPRFEGVDLNLMFQDPDEVVGEIAFLERYSNIFVVPEKMGCHGARVELLRRVRYDTYINLDDDMELTEHTRYGPAIEKAHERGTGFVLTNWARTRKLLDKKLPRVREEFIRQVLIYQGGGMVYSDETADLIRKLPVVHQTFDHSWPLTAYISGLVNYRYMGSLAVHRVCGRGGMAAYMGENPPQLMMEEYVNFRQAKRQNGSGHDVCIPLDADLKPLAHEMHRLAKKRAETRSR